MNQYEHQNASDKINGYFAQRVNETKEAAFLRAKEECLKHMRAAVEHVESIGFDSWAREVRLK